MGNILLQQCFSLLVLVKKDFIIYVLSNLKQQFVEEPHMGVMVRCVFPFDSLEYIFLTHSENTSD